MNIVEFLQARYNDIEIAAKAAGRATADAWALTDGCSLTDGAGHDITVTTDPRDDESFGEHGDRVSAIARHLARHDPEYVLRLVEAHRRILELNLPPVSCEHAHPQDDVYCPTGHGEHPVYRALALPFAHHRDYRAEWKP